MTIKIEDQWIKLELELKGDATGWPCKDDVVETMDMIVRSIYQVGFLEEQEHLQRMLDSALEAVGRPARTGMGEPSERE